MPGYQRFVAYVYEYRKGKKEENCGFVRVEAREERCSIEVHIKCPGLPADVLCEVKGIVRTPDGAKGVTIGTGRTIQNGMEFLISTHTDNLDQNGTGLVDIGGLLLMTEGGAFFGTEWDDVAIVPDEFMRAEEEAKKVATNIYDTTVPIEEENITQPDLEIKSCEPEENVKSEEQELTTKADEINADLSIQEIKEENDYKPSKKEELFDQENPIDKQNGSIEPGSKPMDSEVKKPGENDEKESEETEESRESYRKTDVEPFRNENASASEDNKSTMFLFNPPSEEEEQQFDTKRRNSAQEISAPTTPTDTFEPFSDGEIYDCRKIQPQDMRYLAPRDRMLRNNRFLVHGYHNFGHLLIGRTTSGQYIFGVPGGYDQQERFMASMHGFPYFKESHEIRLHQTRGGYWYRLINPPYFNQRNGL